MINLCTSAKIISYYFMNLYYNGSKNNDIN